MSLLGDLNHEAKKKKLAAEIHKKKQSKKAADRFLDILDNKIWFPIIFGFVSVASATLFLNHYFVGSSELLQFITIASLCLAMLLELGKYWCLNHFFDALSAENLADGQNMLYQPFLLGFFSLCCIALSVTLSIGGVSLYGEESAEKIAEITQKQVVNMVNIDSINQYFEKVKNEKKAIFKEREDDLKAKIEKLNNTEGKLWPQIYAEADILKKVEEQVLKNQNSFSEQIAQIEASQSKHLEAADKKNEQNRVRTIDKEVVKENEKTEYNWKITAFCEGFSLLIAVFIAILEQQVAKESRLENENLKQNSKPILIEEEESMETEIHTLSRELNSVKKLLKMRQQSQEMAIDTPYTPVNSPVNEHKNPIGFQNRQNTSITLYDGKVINVNQYKGSFHRTCFHCGKAIHEQKENAFSCSDACYQNFTQKYGTLKDILGSSGV